MSIIQINDITYIHSDRTVLFEHVSFSVAHRQKAALIGPNGSGKSTLLNLLRGWGKPACGEIAVSGKIYFVPQHFGQYNGLSVAGALGIEEKLKALQAILAGDISAGWYDILQDDWAIEERALEALERWGLSGFSLAQPLASLSGGEKTRVFLSGIDIHEPDLILMDEPSNHLDRSSRERLYDLIRTSPSAMIVVSHDRTLLNLLDTTIELGSGGITSFGGNYEFYKEQKAIQLQALRERVEDREKSLRQAQRVARKATERKEKIDARGKAKMQKEGIPRIMLKKITDGAAASAKNLQEVHRGKIESISEDLRSLREKVPDQRGMKIKLDDSGLHAGKILVTGTSVNYTYRDTPLWENPISFQIRSGERIVIEGDNGSGKTTLLRLILGLLNPTEGTLTRAENLEYLYIDQEYSLLDNTLTIYEQVQRFNSRRLPDHLLKTELHRYLFPAETWEKPCGQLSGGEKMRLVFCCVLVSDTTPDLFVLDEPTNNLDIPSLEIVTTSLRNYRGTLLVISHDRYFTREIGAETALVLSADCGG